MKANLVFLCLGLILISPLKTSSQPQCDQVTAKNIGKLYYLSNPLYVINDWAEFENIVTQNRHLLISNSNIIQCMRVIGVRMQNAGLQNFDPQAGNEAYSSALSMGATSDMASKIQMNVNQGQVELYTLGQELVWLSEVLPSAASGDWTDFVNTGTISRRQTLEYLVLMVSMYSAMEQAELLNLLMTTMNNYQPYLEYQTAVMVSWFSN